MSLYSSTARPDKTLVITCYLNQSDRRIVFSSCRNVTYGLLRSKIEECFSLYSSTYALEYQDDDGEVTSICTDADLTDAIRYFDAGAENTSTSSLLSFSSARSTSQSKMTMGVRVVVGYDGPSLSDTASLASSEDGDARSEYSWTGSDASSDNTPHAPTDVFERLRLAESSPACELASDDRGAAWLREQNARSLHHMVGMLPASPVSSDWSFSLNGSTSSRDGSTPSLNSSMSSVRDSMSSDGMDDSYTPRGGEPSGGHGPPWASTSTKCSRPSIYSTMSASMSSLFSLTPEGQHLPCNGCRKSIRGTLYQCAHCPSRPTAYNLCAGCEKHSHQIHDPMHIFYKLSPPARPTPPRTRLPTLYKHPAGPIGQIADKLTLEEYLDDLMNHQVICDRCMVDIKGKWFRCAFCARDLCADCEAVDAHDNTHIYMLFKSTINVRRPIIDQSPLVGGDDTPQGCELAIGPT